MKATGRDHEITLRRATTAQDEYGASIETWANLATVFARRRRASARETLAAAEVSAAITDVFEILNTPTFTLTPLDRLVFAGRTYDIVSAEPFDEGGRDDALRITAIARAE